MQLSCLTLYWPLVENRSYVLRSHNFSYRARGKKIPLPTQSLFLYLIKEAMQATRRDDLATYTRLILLTFRKDAELNVSSFLYM